MMNTQKFSPYRPIYSPLETLERAFALTGGLGQVAFQSLQGAEKNIAASVEITDRCNAGCHYCYVYPREWDQKQRLQGYLNLPKDQREGREAQVIQRLHSLKNSGVVHVTLVGGEPSLAPDVIRAAADLFPIVWVVSNGAAALPTLPNSVSVFVSMDGPPNFHNQSRDPMGFFDNHHYENTSGMSAAIARNINRSERGAYVHLTLPKGAIELFPEAVEWLVTTITKLRGIIISGTTGNSKLDPVAYDLSDRQRLKVLVEAAADQYGWDLFPFNQPLTNSFMFDEDKIIHDPSECLVAQTVNSLDFDGKSTGKCILRDDADCETCMCNITGMSRAIEKADLNTIFGVLRAFSG
ncbi:MAG: radical SAM protein [Cyanobacteria bacterium J06649_5]